MFQNHLIFNTSIRTYPFTHLLTMILDLYSDPVLGNFITNTAVAKKKKKEREREKEKRKERKKQKKEAFAFGT